VAACTSALAVRFALEHRQAVVVRADAAGEDGVAVVEQVVRGDGGRGEAVGLLHVLRGFVVMCSNTIFSSGSRGAAGSAVAR
jgi:hypothetical protein